MTISCCFLARFAIAAAAAGAAGIGARGQDGKPADADALVRRLLRWARAGEESKTAALLQDALDARPDDAEFALSIARELTATRAPAALATASEAALRRGAAAHEANRLLTDGLARTRRYDEAEAALRRALEAAPDCEECRERLGSLASHYRRHETAIEAWRWLVARSPRDPARRLRLARSLAALERFDAALDEAVEALRLASSEPHEATPGSSTATSPKNPASNPEDRAALREAILVEIATIHEARGDATAGLTTLEALRRDGALPVGASFVEGLLLERAENLERAAAAYEKALGDPVHSTLSHYRLGKTLARLGRADPAAEHLRLYEEARRREALESEMGMGGG
jgi:tetratricopeptide (TPR) repeat protein